MESATELLDGLPTELEPDIAGAYLGTLAATRAPDSLTEITGVREIGPRRPRIGAVNGPPTPHTPFVGRGVPGFNQRRRAQRTLSGECRISDASLVPGFAFRASSCPPGPKLDLCVGVREPMNQKPQGQFRDRPDPKPATTPRDAEGCG